MKNLMACVVVVAFAAVAGCGSTRKQDGRRGRHRWRGWRRGRHRRWRGDCQLRSVHCLRRQHRGDLALRVRVRDLFVRHLPDGEHADDARRDRRRPTRSAAARVFTYTFSGTLNETVNFALGCLSGVTDAGVPQACADLQNLYRTAIGQDAGSSTTQIVSATCSAGQNETCNCTLVFSTPSVTTQGTYTISGNPVRRSRRSPARATFQGPWALFRLFSMADWSTGDGSYSVRWRLPGVAGDRVPPIAVFDVTIPGGKAILQRNFFGGVSCSGRITR